MRDGYAYACDCFCEAYLSSGLRGHPILAAGNFRKDNVTRRHIHPAWPLVLTSSMTSKTDTSLPTISQNTTIKDRSLRLLRRGMMLQGLRYPVIGILPVTNLL